MQPLQRSAVRSARAARSALSRQPRRYAHDSHHDAHHAHGHHGPVNESFGPGFFIGVAAIPAAIVLYKISQQKPDDKPWLTRAIEKWADLKASWQQRNDLHTRMVEEAARDRNLFINSKGSDTVDLRFPEVFNTGSPWNRPAGHTANLDKLIRHYEDKNYAAQAEKLEALQSGTIKSEQPYDHIRAAAGKGTSGV